MRLHVGNGYSHFFFSQGRFDNLIYIHSSSILHPILDRLYHLPTQLGRLLKPRRKKIRRLLKSPFVPTKIPNIYTFTPSSRSDDKLDVIRTVDPVGQSGAKSCRKESWRAEKVLGDTYNKSSCLLVRAQQSKKKMDIPIQSINTGVPATSKCSYGRIPNFAQQSTIAKRLK